MRIEESSRFLYVIQFTFENAIKASSVRMISSIVRTHSLKEQSFLSIDVVENSHYAIAFYTYVTANR